MHKIYSSLNGIEFFKFIIESDFLYPLERNYTFGGSYNIGYGDGGETFQNLLYGDGDGDGSGSGVERELPHKIFNLEYA